jgi:hypothetical protein
LVEEAGVLERTPGLLGIAAVVPEDKMSAGIWEMLKGAVGDV